MQYISDSVALSITMLLITGLGKYFLKSSPQSGNLLANSDPILAKNVLKVEANFPLSVISSPLWTILEILDLSLLVFFRVL